MTEKKKKPPITEEVKADTVKKLTDADYDRLLNQQKYSMFGLGSFRARVALHSDTLHRNVVMLKRQIEEALWSIRTGKEMIKRKEDQLKDGKIYELLPINNPDMKIIMNEHELKLQVELEQRHMEANAKDIINPLNELSGHIGYHDLAKNMIISEQEFEVYANEIENRVKALGYEIYDDTIKNPQPKR